MKGFNTAKEALEYIASIHGREIEVVGKLSRRTYTIQKIIPMYRPDYIGITDVEILLEKKKNAYFSINKFLEGDSWVAAFKIGDINLSARKMTMIYPVPENDLDWIKTAELLQTFVEKTINN